jgi:hypothetical protein
MAVAGLSDSLIGRHHRLSLLPLASPYGRRLHIEDRPPRASSPMNRTS